MEKNIQNHNQLAELGRSVPKQIISVEMLYNALSKSNELSEFAELMLKLRSWLTEISEFDETTGITNYTNIDCILDKIQCATASKSDNIVKDRVYQISSYSHQAICSIFANLREKTIRRHEIQPIYKVREVDCKSINWLSRQPGRNVREKLAGKPYLLAVKKQISEDTAENRLLKAFSRRFEHILIERQDVLNDTVCENYLIDLQRWLRNESIDEIGEWGNLPPNNILLQDKNYRKILDAWRTIQILDDNISNDCERVQKDYLTVIFWTTISLLNQYEDIRIAQLPLNIDYDDFQINPMDASIEISGCIMQDFSLDQQTGIIRQLDKESKSGFIDNFKFNSDDLAKNLEFNELNLNQKCSFLNDSESDLITEIECISNPIYFKLYSDKFEIVIGTNVIETSVHDNFINLTKANTNHSKKFEMKIDQIQKISKAMASLICNSNRKSSKGVPSYNILECEHLYIDLFSIRPEIKFSKSKASRLPFKLLRQHWKTNTENVKN